MIVGRASVAPVLDPSRPVVGRGWLSRGEGPTASLVTTPGELPVAGVRLDRPLMPLNPALRWQISGMLRDGVLRVDACRPAERQTRPDEPWLLPVGPTAPLAEMSRVIPLLEGSPLDEMAGCGWSVSTLGDEHFQEITMVRWFTAELVEWLRLHPDAAIGHRIVPIIANDPADLID